MARNASAGWRPGDAWERSLNPLDEGLSFAAARPVQQTRALQPCCIPQPQPGGPKRSPTVRNPSERD